MEELVLKVRADAKGVKPELEGIAKETDNLKFSGEKASGVLRGFTEDLKRAGSITEVSSAALKAFSQILSASIGGAAVAIIGKTLVDAFVKVSESVDNSKKAVEEANIAIGKLGSIKSFEDGARQADLLYAATEKVNAEIEKLEKNKLFDLVATIRGAKDEMIALAATTKQQADEALKAGIIQSAIDLQRKDSLSDIDKAIIQSNASYSKLIDSARKLGDVELLNSLIIDSQKAAMAIKRKAEHDAEAKAQEEWYKRADAAWSAEEKATEKQTSANKKQVEERLGGISKIFEAEQKAAAARDEEQAKERQRSAERISAIEAEINALERRNENLRSQNAEDVLLGTIGRGAGQTPTSEEIGFENRKRRELEEARRREANRQEIEEVNRLREEARKKQKEEGISYKGPDPESIGRREARKSLAEKAIAQAKKDDPFLAMSEAIKTNTDKIKELTTAKDAEKKATESATEGFFKIGEGVDLVATSLDTIGTSSESASLGLTSLDGNLTLAAGSVLAFSGNADSAKSSIEGLAGAAAGASGALSSFMELGTLQSLTTNTIILQN